MVDAGMVFYSESVEEIADHYGIDADGLAATVERNDRARAEWQLAIDGQLRRLGIDMVEISTAPDASYLPAIHSLFKKRESRRTA